MAINTSDFPEEIFSPEQVEIFTRGVAERSPFLSAGRRVETNEDGTVVRWVNSAPTANFVAEGARKPESDVDIDALHLKPVALAMLIRMSEKAAPKLGIDVESGRITSASLAAEIAGAFANRVTDEIIFGTQLAGQALKNAPAVTYDGTPGSLLTALAGAIRNVRSGSASWVADRELETEAILASATAGAQPLWLASTAEKTEFGQKNRILGYDAQVGNLSPLKGVENLDALAYFGNFKNLVWAQLGDIKAVRLNGAITLDDGTVRTLADHNEIAIRLETDFAFGFAGGVSQFTAVRKTDPVIDPEA